MTESKRYEQETEIHRGSNGINIDHIRSSYERVGKGESKSTGESNRYLGKAGKQHQDHRKVEEAEEEHLRLCGICKSRI